jgi:putative ABC transport system permease protein
MRRHEWLLTLVVLATAACDPKAEPRVPPPADSYTAGTHQVKIGDFTSTIQTAAVTPGYFELARIPLVSGRQFVPADHESGAPRVVILGLELARTRFSSMDPIGRTIELNGSPATIVGITGEGAYPEGTLLFLPK